PFFYVAVLVGVVSFVASIYFGGRDTKDMYYAGFDRTWDLAKGKPQFNKQAIFTIVVLMALILTILFGGLGRAETPSKEVTAVIADNARFHARLDSMEVRQAHYQSQTSAACYCQKTASTTHKNTRPM